MRKQAGPPQELQKLDGVDLNAPPPAPRIMVVDDCGPIRQLLKRTIDRHGYSCDTADSLREARALLDGGTYDILFLDLQLDDGSGVSILEEDRDKLGPHATVVFVTVEHDLDTAVDLIRKGAYDFIAKPFSLAVFEERLEKAVGEWRSRVRFEHYQSHLENLVRTMTGKLLTTTQQIERIYDMTVAALGSALDLRDPETEEHCRRVAEHSVRLARVLGLKEDELRRLRWGAYLHDIGKIGIPEHILQKPSSLTAEEMEVVKTHPLLGFRMISTIEFLKEATDVVLYHHEKFDGSGYPYGLKGEEIPLAARIFAVIDVMDAMIFDRPYRQALPFAALVEEVTRQAGRHLDPEVVERFLGIPEDAWRVEPAARRGGSGCGTAESARGAIG